MVVPFELRKTINRIDQLLIELQTKHFPYKHDQRDHGRGKRGGGISGGVTKGKTTEEMWRNRDGSWKKERQKLHDEIVASYFKGKTPVENPTAYLMGGGTASGKSSIRNAGLVNLPKNMVMVDSDDIKDMLPEYQQMLKAKDSRAAGLAHDESSYLSKRIIAEASAKGYNVGLDGTGNSTIDSLKGKVARLKKGGQTLKANYVTLDVEKAIIRENIRAKKRGRKVAESVIRRTHKGASLAGVAGAKIGLFDEVNFWDNNGSEPVLIARGKGKNLEVLDQKKWKKFVAKGKS